MPTSALLRLNLHVLICTDDGTHRRDIETKQHATHGSDACEEVDIVELWELVEHLGGQKPSKLKRR